MALVKKSFSMPDDCPLWGGSKPKRIWMEVVTIDLKKCSLSEDLAQDRLEWRKKIHVTNPNMVGKRL